MTTGAPSFAAAPPDGAGVVEAVVGLLAGEAGHRRVVGLGRRACVLGRLDRRNRSILDALHVVYPTDWVAAGLFRLGGWGGHRPVDTAGCLDRVLAEAPDRLGRRLRVFHFGERPGRGPAAMEALARRHPGIEAVGVRTVQDELWGPENNQALFRISDAAPDLLLVALPSPLLEDWIHAHTQLVPVRVAWGIGR